MRWRLKPEKARYFIIKINNGILARIYTAAISGAYVHKLAKRGARISYFRSAGTHTVREATVARRKPSFGSRAERAPAGRRCCILDWDDSLGQSGIPRACLRGHIATDIYNDVVCEHVKSLRHDRARTPHRLTLDIHPDMRGVVFMTFGRYPKPASGAENNCGPAQKLE